MLSLLCLDCPAGSAGAGGFRGLVPCKSMCWRTGFNWTIQDSFGKQQLSKLQWWHLSKPDSMKMMCSRRGLLWTARGCCCCRCCVGCLRKFSPAFGRLEPLSIKVILSLMICTKSLHMSICMFHKYPTSCFGCSHLMLCYICPKSHQDIPIISSTANHMGTALDASLSVLRLKLATSTWPVRISDIRGNYLASWAVNTHHLVCHVWDKTEVCMLDVYFISLACKFLFLSWTKPKISFRSLKLDVDKGIRRATVQAEERVRESVCQRGPKRKKTIWRLSTALADIWDSWDSWDSWSEAWKRLDG